MAEDWLAVQAEVASALGEMELEVLLHRKPQRENPWEWSGDFAAPISLRAVNLGEREMFSRSDEGELVPRRAIVLMVEAGVAVPVVGDTIGLFGKNHAITRVQGTQPSDTAVVYRLELEITASRALT